MRTWRQLFNIPEPSERTILHDENAQSSFDVILRPFVWFYAWCKRELYDVPPQVDPSEFTPPRHETTHGVDVAFGKVGEFFSALVLAVVTVLTWVFVAVVWVGAIVIVPFLMLVGLFSLGGAAAGLLGDEGADDGGDEDFEFDDGGDRGFAGDGGSFEFDGEGDLEFAGDGSVIGVDDSVPLEEGPSFQEVMDGTEAGATATGRASRVLTALTASENLCYHQTREGYSMPVLRLTLLLAAVVLMGSGSAECEIEEGTPSPAEATARAEDALVQTAFDALKKSEKLQDEMYSAEASITIAELRRESARIQVEFVRSEAAEALRMNPNDLNAKLRVEAAEKDYSEHPSHAEIEKAMAEAKEATAAHEEAQKVAEAAVEAVEKAGLKDKLLERY